jgi:hypothetical protein
MFDTDSAELPVHVCDDFETSSEGRWDMEDIYVTFHGSRHRLILYLLLVLDWENGITEHYGRLQKEHDPIRHELVWRNINAGNVRRILNLAEMSRNSPHTWPCDSAYIRV